MAKKKKRRRRGEEGQGGRPKASPAAQAKRAPELAAVGRSVRKEIPRSQLGTWVAPADRRDPVDVLAEQSVGRLEDLVPLRYARMSASAFTFYRGAAALMANDLGTQAQHRADRAAGRRRAPGQLRRLRHRGAVAGLRPERLRRDPARALRVGREAAGGQLRGRRAAPAVHPRAVRRDPRGGCGGVPQRDGRVRGHAPAGCLVRPDPGRGHPEQVGRVGGSGAHRLLPAHPGQGPQEDQRPGGVALHHHRTRR